jgi:hypothetical protein
MAPTLAIGVGLDALGGADAELLALAVAVAATTGGG